MSGSYFDLGTKLGLTEFERAVYREVIKIPLGEVRTYGEIAKAIGCPKGARAVGQALKRNPFPLLIPCHRVVAKNGIGGFSKGVEEKRYLLALEKQIKEWLYGDDIS